MISFRNNHEAYTQNLEWFNLSVTKSNIGASENNSSAYLYQNQGQWTHIFWCKNKVISNARTLGDTLQDPESHWDSLSRNYLKDWRLCYEPWPLWPYNETHIASEKQHDEIQM